MRVYRAKVAVRYDGERDEVAVYLASPAMRPARQAALRVLFDLDQSQRLVRVEMNDSKMARLGVAVAHLTPTEVPATWTWGHVAYDELARVALIYCGPLADGDLGVQVSRRGMVDLDAAGRLLAVRAPCRGGQGTTLLRSAAAQG
jgi:hypothetical protein